jgi:sugar diacid utilization regulator
MRPELQDIVDEAARILRSATVLEDLHFNLIAYAVQHPEVDVVRRDSILQRRSTRAVRAWFEQFGIASSTVPLRTPADPTHGLQARICFPARSAGVTHGYLWALDETTSLDDPAVSRTAALAETAAAYLAQLSRQHADDASAVTDLVGTDRDRGRTAAARLADHGVLDWSAPVVVVVVGTWGCGSAGVWPNLWNLPRNILVDAGPTGAVLVVPLRQIDDDGPAREVAALALDLYRRELPDDGHGTVGAGIGTPRQHTTELHACWREARTAARIAATSPAVGPVVAWPSLGLYRLLSVVPSAELASVVLDAPVRCLLDSADADLVQTVTVFLDNAGNVAETAAALHIHRQTLYYRLSKAEALTGLSFGNGHDRARLHIGLMLAPLLDAD